MRREDGRKWEDREWEGRMDLANVQEAGTGRQCLFTVDTGHCYLTFQEKNLQNFTLNKQVEEQHMESCQDNSHKHFNKIFSN